MSCADTRSFYFDRRSVRANSSRLIALAKSADGWAKVVIYTNSELTGPDTFTLHTDDACGIDFLVGAMTPADRAELVLAIALEKPVELRVEKAVVLDLSLPSRDDEKGSDEAQLATQSSKAS